MRHPSRNPSTSTPTPALSALAFGLAAVLNTTAAVAQPGQTGESVQLAHAVQTSQAAPQAAVPGPLRLGLPYVAPPHAPGAKVRTPEGLAPLLAQRLAKELPVQLVQAGAVDKSSGAAAAVAAVESVDAPETPNAWLMPVDAAATPLAGKALIPTGYRAGFMAIMRTDTDIQRWEDLRGRTVCLAEESGLRGRMHARYGAIEKVFRAPADALLDLRIGGCDATVHDSSMLQALLDFPEWQKFSAQLPVQDEREWAFVLPTSDYALVQHLQSQVQQWQDSDLLTKLTAQRARDIAFEVYLDQEVPDCH